MRPKESILREISEGVSESYDRVAINEEELFAKLSESRGHTILKMIYVLTLLFCSILVIIHIAMFLLHDVLFYRNEMQINSQGALIPTKACGCEQALFLFNASDLWADTGIQVREGDRIKITASGAIHTSLNDIHDAAAANRRPSYPWVGSNLRKLTARHRQDPEQFRLDSFVYKGMYDDLELAIDTASYYGAILYQIRPGSVACQPEPGGGATPHAEVYRLDDHAGYFAVPRSGTLYFAINDIYLTDRLIRQMGAENWARWKQFAPHGTDSLSAEPIPYDAAWEKRLAEAEGCLALVQSEEGRLYCWGPTFEHYFSKHPDVWYNDNLGQIALMIDIRRKIEPTSSRFWYRKIETALFGAMDRGAWGSFILCVCALLAGCAALSGLVVVAVLALVFLLPGLLYGGRWCLRKWGACKKKG